MLKCKVNTKEFQESLKKIEVIIPNKTKLEVLKTVKLSVTDNTIQLTATDLENYAIATIYDVQIENSGGILISNIKEIIKSFKFMKENYTEIEVKSGNVIITNGDKNIKVKGELMEDFPEEFEVGNINNEYVYNTKSLHNRIQKVNYARSKDKARPTLEGLHFNDIDMVTLDGFRAALSKDNVLKINNHFTIRGSVIDFLIKTLNKKSEEALKIYTSDKHIIIEYENLILKSILLEGEFFDYKRVFPTEYNKFRVNTEKLKEDSSFLNIYTKKIKNQLIEIDIKENKMNLSANTEEGVFSVENNINKKIELNIGLNNKYLSDALKVVDSKSIDIKFTHSINPVVIQDGENEEHLILPVKLAS